MKPKHTRRLYIALAVLSVATCHAFGAGCIQTILASIGVTFF